MSDLQAPNPSDPSGLEVAIIGMAGRFPGAPDLNSFWQNLVDGVESIEHWEKKNLASKGVAADLIEAPDFVAAGAPLAGHDRFDAEFFGYSPREAEILDPQQRLFLECAWQALETAGYISDCYPGAIGVYAATGMNNYLFNLYDNAHVRSTVTPYELFIANDKDFIASRTAYKLNLRGPGITVQTACSSSLVAVHMAVQSLLAGECDMALAGSAALSLQLGYRAREGSILSPDGHCRAFDAKAAGTVGGSGVGIVVLKRLEDALADGDTIDAIIQGSAVNNDGALKASFTAPQVDSQAEVIASAQAAAGVIPDSISYVEAHGTGTILGDPIEVAALTQAFRRSTTRSNFCALGSVKTNIGHLDTAAGIAGLIKAVLMLRHRQIPPSLHFESPNPKIDFVTSPFFVNTKLQDWSEGDTPRRAGVSSFGIGGTNAHVILEEAPTHASTPARPGADPELLLISARNAQALAETATALAAHLETPTPPPLADTAHTLRQGRQSFAYRQWVVASDNATAATKLRALSDIASATADDAPDPILLFPGQGSQYPGMARVLYAGLPAYREAFDQCCIRLDELLAADFRTWLFESTDEIHQTASAQPALFAVEYALARFWMALGVHPRALHGHSIGEYVAACLAEVFDLDTALAMVVERGRLMQAAPPGAMLAVIHPGTAIDQWLDADIALAASNAPGLSVVSGPEPAVSALRDRLAAARVDSRLLQTSHAFHSPMMDEAASAFEAVVARSTLHPPRLPVISNLSGTWLTEAEATDPGYWVRHLLGTVRFGEGSKTLLTLPQPVFIEAGPGRVLSQLTNQQASGDANVIPGIMEGENGNDEVTQILAAAGCIWRAGCTLDWTVLGDERRRRVPLPTYPFQSQRYWVEPDTASGTTRPAISASSGAGSPEGIFYRPSWRRAPTAVDNDSAGRKKRWLILDDGELGGALAERFERSGNDAYRALSGDGFGEPDYRCFSISPFTASDHKALMDALAEREAIPDHIVFLWPLEAELANNDTGPVQALQTVIDVLASNPRPLRLTVVTRGAADVTGAETLIPEQALIQGLLQVASQEYPWLGCRQIDLDPEQIEPVARIADRLQLELNDDNVFTAFRGRNRWEFDFALHALPQPAGNVRLRRNGVFVIAGDVTGGLGRIWAEALAELPGARLAILQNTKAPPLSAPDGIETLDRRLDCTDASALSSALAEIAATWGRIDGLFFSSPLINHAAVAPITLLRQDHWKYNHATKIAPMHALAAALSEHPVGFCCVQSSLSTVVGGVGLAAYAAAYHFIDSFTAARDREGSTPWFSINYAVADEAPNTDSGRWNAGTNPFALGAEETWNCTRRIIEAGLSGQTVISGGDIAAARLQAETPQAETTAAADHCRPELATPFVAPRNEIEVTVTNILQDLLGIEAIGVDDDFFELGGHSLLAIRAIAQLREAFPVDMEMRELLFENPTAAGMARAITVRLPEQSNLDAMASLLDQVEGLSEQEITDQLPGAKVQ